MGDAEDHIIDTVIIQVMNSEPFNLNVDPIRMYALQRTELAKTKCVAEQPNSDSRREFIPSHQTKIM